MESETIVLSALAKLFNVNKSKLSYYYSLGLIKESSFKGKTAVFDKDYAVKRLKRIEELKVTNPDMTIPDIIDFFKNNTK